MLARFYGPPDASSSNGSSTLDKRAPSVAPLSQDVEDLNLFLATHPEALADDFVPPVVAELEDRTRMAEAALANVRLRISDKDRELDHLRREVTELKRTVNAQTSARALGVDAERWADKAKFLENELAQSTQREQAAVRDKLALQEAHARALEKTRDLEQQLHQQRKASKVPRAVLPEAAAVPVPKRHKAADAPSPLAPASAAVGTTPPDYHRVFIRRVYSEDFIFRLLQQRGVDADVTGQDAHEVAVQVSAMFADNAGPEALVVTLARFAAHTSEVVVESALAVMHTLVSTVPAVRAHLHECMETVHSQAHMAVVDNVAIDEDHPWDSLLSVLLHRCAASSQGLTVSARLVALLALIADGASDEALSTFIPLVDTLLARVLHAHQSCAPLVLRVDCLRLLLSMISCEAIYRRARQALPDGSSLLSHVALLMSRDHATTESLETVCLLRQSAVRVFSVIVATYSDWSTCTTVDGRSGPDGVSALRADKRVEWDLGLRLVLLLHDTIQQLRTDISAGAPKDRLATLSSVVVDSFLLLAECAKDPSVELRLFDKLVRQLYVTALVALAAPRPLHASLAVVRPHADALLSALASHCKAAER